MLLKDKVVLVTGSTTGIGEAIARKCVAEGASVMVHGRREHAAQGLCAELGDAAAYTVGDVADPELCESLVANTVNRFGRIDGVANNAATTARATIEQTDAATFDRHYHINLRAPALIIRAALPHFRALGEGTVVNIGSVNAWSGQADLMPYSASKGGFANDDPQHGQCPGRGSDSDQPTERRLVHVAQRDCTQNLGGIAGGLVPECSQGLRSHREAPNP